MTKITYGSIIENKKALRDSIIIIMIGCLIIGFGIGVAVYDGELTNMFTTANNTGRPIDWHGKYYTMVEVHPIKMILTSNTPINTSEWCISNTTIEKCKEK